MRKFSLFILCLCIGCAGATPTQQGAMGGAAVGAGAGAIVGNSFDGQSGEGAAIGAAAGAVTGALVGDSLASTEGESKVAAQKEQIRRQEEKIAAQEREMEELRRQE